MGSKRIYEFYNEHAKECDPDDLWRQVRRSVGGKAVGKDQIEMIVAAVLQGLELDTRDVVLDLCCGNGVLSDRIFDSCRGGLGVDFAEYLIGIARRHFERPGEREYVVGDVEEFAATAADTERFSKVLCYGSFAYLSEESAHALLQHLRDRFPAVRRLFIGNLPDKAKLDDFRRLRSELSGVENDHESALGLWRTMEEFAQLAAGAGWQAAFTKMPADFYAVKYRYDVALTPVR